MSSFYEISGNNLPELTSTSSPREYVQYFRQLITRKRNLYSDPEMMAKGYNLAINELVEELDRLEYKIDELVSSEKAIKEANRVFNLCAPIAGAAE